MLTRCVGRRGLSEDGVRTLASLELQSREAVAACTAARLAAAERTAALQTRLGEQLLSQGRELLAAGEAELGAARRARDAPSGAEPEPEPRARSAREEL